MKKKDLQNLSKAELVEAVWQLSQFIQHIDRIVMHKVPRSIGQVYIKKAYAKEIDAKEAIDAVRIANMFSELIKRNIKSLLNSDHKYYNRMINAVDTYISHRHMFHRWSNTVWFDSPEYEELEEMLIEVNKVD